MKLHVGERHVECGHHIIKMLDFGGADNGRGDTGLMQQPGQGNLRWWQTALNY